RHSISSPASVKTQKMLFAPQSTRPLLGTKRLLEGKQARIPVYLVQSRPVLASQNEGNCFFLVIFLSAPTAPRYPFVAQQVGDSPTYTLPGIHEFNVGTEKIPQMASGKYVVGTSKNKLVDASARK